MVLGRKLIPLIAESDKFPLIAFLTGFASIALQSPISELWILPVCLILDSDKLSKIVYASGVGIFTSSIFFLCLGKYSGEFASISFLIDTTGLKGIHDYQSAREIFGYLVPFTAGWIMPVAELFGKNVPSLRDTAIMAGQRELFNPLYFTLLIGIQVFVRASLLRYVIYNLKKHNVILTTVQNWTLLYWIFLLMTMFV